MMQRTSQIVSGLGAEHRDDSGPGSVTLCFAVLKDIFDLIQISSFIAKESDVFRIRFLGVLRLFLALTYTFREFLLEVCV